MATTPALQDGDVWLLLACNENGRLSVALMHADRFSFELDGSSSLHVQSATVQHHRHGGTLAAGADRDRSAARASCHAAARRGAGALGLGHGTGRSRVSLHLCTPAERCRPRAAAFALLGQLNETC